MSNPHDPAPGSRRTVPVEDETPAAGGDVETASDAPELVVGLGSSAGGVPALLAFLEGLPDDPDMAFVVIVHLNPERESRLAEVLQSHTSLRVVQVTEPVPLRRGEVYVIPPGRSLVLTDGRVTTAGFEHPRWQRAPIDIFFRSLAKLGPRAVAVVLSGTGTDGTLGVRAVEEAGGLVLVQDPSDAEHDGMPSSALRGGHADMVLPAAELGATLCRLAEHRQRLSVPSEDELAEEEEEALTRILDRLRAQTGHDFNRYKRSTLLRRIGRRMSVNGVDTLPAYAGVLRQNAGEAPLLLRDLLIRVTSFFRDPGVWAAFEHGVVPRLFERRAPEETLRVWVPACATGEEAYTIVMHLLVHASELERRPEILVFASDLDQDAVAFGRAGVYPEAIEADVPQKYLSRFFTREDASYRVTPEVRGHVVFAAHSLFRNPPFSRLDLISCRNLLIYLERDLQEDALRVFHYALRPGGALVLGTAESVDAAGSLFKPDDAEHRIFHRVDGMTVHPPAIPKLHRVETRALETGDHREIFDPARRIPARQRHETLLEELAPPSLAVDGGYAIVHLSESAGRFLRRPGGVPSHDVLIEIVPDLRVELQEALADAFEHDRSTSRGPIHVSHGDEGEWVHLVVRPGGGSVETRDHALVMFVEAGEAGAEPDPVASEHLEDERVAHLQAELLRLRERLQATIEEYEASREEMKASNEELQSINEEHKSTTEELETSREELQSVNEELEAVNRELSGKLEEISQSNSDLQNLMASTEVGTLFLDRDLRIQRFTPRVSEIFRIGASDHGRAITDFTHSLAYDGLVEDAHHVLRSLAPIEHEVAGPGGTWFLLTLRPYRTVEDSIEGVVVTLVEITRRKEAEDGLIALTEALEEQVAERTEKLASALDLFQSLFHVSPAPIAITRCSDERLIDFNHAYRELLGYGPEDGGQAHHVADEHWTNDTQRKGVLEELEHEGQAGDIEVQLTTSSGERRTALTFAKRVTISGEPHDLWVFIDITARKVAEGQVRSLASKLTLAEQEERSRVAQVLHEDLQQRLYSARYKLGIIRERAKDSAEVMGALSSLGEVENWLDQAIAETRRLSVDLSPPVLEGEGLAETLGWLVAQMKETHGLEVSLVVDKQHRIRRSDQRVMMFQIVRELLLNVVEHAGVDRAHIGISEAGDLWVIEVTDDGVGFDAGILEHASASEYGLSHLRERIGLFGGQLTLKTGPRKGTRITIFLPKLEEPEG